MTSQRPKDQDKLCEFHTPNDGAAIHPDAMKRLHALVAARSLGDPEDEYLQWELVYDKFMGCDVCVHEQLNFLSSYAAYLLKNRDQP